MNHIHFEDLQYIKSATCDFEGDGLDYFDYSVSLKFDDDSSANYNFERSDLENLKNALEMILNAIKGSHQ